MSSSISRASSREDRADEIATGMPPCRGISGIKYSTTPRAPQNRPAPFGRTLSGLPKRGRS